MGSCASKPPPPPRKPNPYTHRDASEPLHAMPQARGVREKRRSRSIHSPSAPTKHLKAALHGSVEAKGGAVRAVEGDIMKLDRKFGLSNNFASVFEVGEEIGRGHFGYTCSAVAKKGELKGLKVAVKIIPKSKMLTAIAIEGVRREIKILQTLTEHPNLAQVYGAFEDLDNVFIVMELCTGGELLDRILERKYSEGDAKVVIIQILKAVAFLHLHGVVHRDIKPENFLFASEDENSQLKAIDFGLSDFVEHDKKLTETVGSAYYAAPEVLHKSYDTGADVWSVGVVAYILLCGTRPFWAQSESDIFVLVTEANPNFDDDPWPSLSPESKDFVRCLLHRDLRLRISAAQALCHPWLQKQVKTTVPLDILIFKLLKVYMQSSYLRKAALRALSKTLTADELYYLKEQFALLYPEERGGITFKTIKTALVKNAPGATKSHIEDLLKPLNALQYRRMYFEEFCAAALNISQLEVLESWGERIHSAYDIFDQNGNRAIVIEELASELELSPSMSVHTVLKEWVKQSDGKLTFLGFSKLICRRMLIHQDCLELQNDHH